MRALILFPFFALALFAEEPVRENQAPVEEFVLPFFDNQGKRSALLRGDAARSLSSTEFTINGLHFAHFVPPGQTRPETVLLSPVAHVFLKNRSPIISGPEVVRLVRDGLEASGEDWTYEHAQRKLTLRRAVRVTYSAELKDLLP